MKEIRNRLILILLIPFLLLFSRPVRYTKPRMSHRMYRDSEPTIMSSNFNGGLNHYYTTNELKTKPAFLDPNSLNGNTNNLLRFNMSSWTWLVTENSKMGTFLKNAKTGENVYLKMRKQKNVEDTSQNQNITFYLENWDITSRLKVDKITGAVTVNNNFDYERSKQHTFVVIASNGHYNITSRAKVFVIDENDEKPTFLKNVYNFIVPESTKVGSKIGQVSAYDKDTGFGGKVKYIIETGENGFGKDEENADFVEIDSINGTIYLKRALDYEAKKRLTFKITAQDSLPMIMAPLKEPLSSSVRAIITIVDSPDTPPIWTDTTIISIKIPENTPPGSKIGQITAIDGDRGESEANIYYRAVDQPTEGIVPWPMIYNPNQYQVAPVDIEVTTGELFLIGDMDFEKENERNMIITIEAYEGYYDENSDPDIDEPIALNIIARTLLIQLLDSDDNLPRIGLLSPSSEEEQNRDQLSNDEPFCNITIPTNTNIFNNPSTKISIPIKIFDKDSWPLNEAYLKLDHQASKLFQINPIKIRGYQDEIQILTKNLNFEEVLRVLYKKFMMRVIVIDHSKTFMTDVNICLDFEDLDEEDVIYDIYDDETEDGGVEEDGDTSDIEADYVPPLSTLLKSPNPTEIVLTTPSKMNDPQLFYKTNVVIEDKTFEKQLEPSKSHQSPSMEEVTDYTSEQKILDEISKLDSTFDNDLNFMEMEEMNMNMNEFLAGPSLETEVKSQSSYSKPEIKLDPNYINKNTNSNSWPKITENKFLSPIKFSIYDDDEDFFTYPEGSGGNALDSSMNDINLNLDDIYSDMRNSQNRDKSTGWSSNMKQEEILSLSGEFAEYFKLKIDQYEENKVDLIQIKQFDYEKVQKVELELVACDHRRLCGLKKLDFMVLPVNEHTPRKPEIDLNKNSVNMDGSYINVVAPIDQNKTLVGKISSVDKDVDDILNYEIVSDHRNTEEISSLFTVDARTGELYLLQAKDISIFKPTQILKITAKDESKVSEPLVLNVRISEQEQEEKILEDFTEIEKDKTPDIFRTTEKPHIPETYIYEDEDYSEIIDDEDSEDEVLYDLPKIVTPDIIPTVISTIPSHPNNHPPSVSKVHKFSIREGNYKFVNEVIGKIDVFDLDYTEESDFTVSEVDVPSFTFYNKTVLPKGIKLDKERGEIVANDVLDYESVGNMQFLRS